MVHAKTKAASPTAKHKQRPTAGAPVKAHVTISPAPLQSVTSKEVVETVVQQHLPPELRPATPAQRTRKRVVRRPKYHEATSFLERESFKGLAPTDGLPLGPNNAWFPGTTLGESYRVASTISRAAKQAALETRPVSWGYGYTDGALGHNNTRRQVVMKRLAFFRRTIVRAVSAGNRLSLFLTDNNRVFQSGRLFMKQDGCAMLKPVEIAMDLVELPATRPRIVAVEAGHLAAYALDDQGNLYSWGAQIFGQLGHGEDLDPEVTPCNDIAEAEGGGSINGEEHSTRQHDVENHHEEDEDDAEPQPKIVIVERIPKLVEGLVGHAIVKISAGNHFVVAVTTNGSVFSWGRGCFGQLGNGDFANVSTPAQIDALKAYTAVDIAAGLNHVLGVFVVRDDLSLSNQQEAPDNSLLQQYEDTSPSERTVVMVWGRGKHGCLGLGGSKNEVCPCESTFFRGLAPAKVAAGADHSLVMCRVGARTFLYAFGGNQLGQLGIASGVDHVDMPSFLDEFVNVHVASIGAGSQYSAALTGDGEVFTWGDARFGKTCRSDGRTTFVPWKVDMPNTIPSSSFITQLSVGSHHALAQLRMSGEVDRWRKFPLDGIVTALGHSDDTIKVSLCRCKSSQTTTHSAFGIFAQCETCRIAPICRACSRRCHRSHTIRPLALGGGLNRDCLCSEDTTSSQSSCTFALKLPPTIKEEAWPSISDRT